MTTKARRREQLKCLARLSSQSRLNAGDASSRGRTAESVAWSDVAAFLDAVAAWSRISGLPVQASLFEAMP